MAERSALDANLIARRDAALNAVERELSRAQSKFATFNSPHEGWAVIREELDELWEHVKGNTGHSEDAYVEAIQTAAMALRYACELTAASGGIV